MKIITIKSTEQWEYDLSFSGIKYYCPSYYESVMILCLEENEQSGCMDHKEIPNSVIGMIELQQSPFEENKVWMKFISVHEEYKGKGLSSKLIEELINVMRNSFNDKILVRSSTSKHAPMWFRDFMTDKLNKGNLKWEQEVYKDCGSVLEKNY